MAEITLIVDPGADDILIDGVSLNDIDAFRDECLTAGAVSCDWDTLHTRLISHDISRMWWFLTETERRSIAEHAIKNTLFYQINFKGTGEPDCGGAINFVYLSNPCVANSIIRFLKFNSSLFSNIDACYWKRTIDDDVFCYRADQTYQLPCYMVDCSSGHTMCSIQVAPKRDDLDNWVVFQYWDSDIKPGHWQMPTGTKVTINTPKVFSAGCSGYSYSGSVAEFEV